MLESGPRATLDTLQAGRGLAALAVVLLHVELYVSQQIGPLPPILASVMRFGYLGVDFFFVLSGFIIYYANSGRVDQANWARGYAESRLTRIYVPYLPIALALALTYSLLPQLSRGDHHWNWFSTLTLLPSSAEPSMHVAWTLQHEILFYGIAFLMLATGRVLLGSLVWAGLIIVLLPMKFMLQPILSPIDLEFIFGMAVAWAYLNGAAPSSRLLVAAGGCFAGLFLVIGDRFYSVLFGLGLALLLLPLLRLESRGKIRPGRILTGLGDASYAIYLIHMPLLSVVVRVCADLGPLASSAIGIVASLGAGYLYHRVFERPALRWCKARLRSLRAHKPLPADAS